MGDPEKLSEPIPDVQRGGHPLQERVSAVRQNRRDPGPDRVACDQGRVADPDPGHIGDRVGRTGGEHAGCYAEIACARPPLRVDGPDGDHEEQRNQHSEPHGYLPVAPATLDQRPRGTVHIWL